MPHYRRSLAGTTYFFTVVTHQRRPILCDAAVRTALREGIQRVRARHPFDLDAIVLMPDHLHCIWTLPDGDIDFSLRWSQIKYHVSYTCGDQYPATLSKSRQRQRSAAIWEHQIRDELDMERHVDYIHFNPVKHGFVRAASAWPYSSFGRFVLEGIYPANWGGNPACDGMEFE